MITNWTEERIADLRRLWTEGASASGIATILGGITRNAVIGKAHRLGLEPRREAMPGSGRPDASRPKPPPRVSNPIGRPRSVVSRLHKAPKEKTELTPEIVANPVQMLDLKPHHCRWPVGPVSHDMLHCGADAIDGKPYCAKHCGVAYRAPQQQRGSRPDWWCNKFKKSYSTVDALRLMATVEEEGVA